MKRAPLERRTPLRSTTELTRRTRLAPMSKKRRRIREQRAALVRTELASRPVCEAGNTIRAEWANRFGIVKANELASRSAFGCRHWAVELHEPLTRARGGDILDPANTIAICRGCHDWIHHHPERATALGLLASRTEGTSPD